MKEETRELIHPIYSLLLLIFLISPKEEEARRERERETSEEEGLVPFSIFPTMNFSQKRKESSTFSKRTPRPPALLVGEIGTLRTLLLSLSSAGASRGGSGRKDFKRKVKECRLLVLRPEERRRSAGEITARRNKGEEPEDTWPRKTPVNNLNRKLKKVVNFENILGKPILCQKPGESGYAGRT